MSDTGGLKIVQVGVAPNEAIALWWKDILGEEGIPSFIRPGGIGMAYFSNALNEQYIMVREDQSELALEILNEITNADEAEFSEG
jgi:hypothetical protein